MIDPLLKFCKTIKTCNLDIQTMVYTFSSGNYYTRYGPSINLSINVPKYEIDNTNNIGDLLRTIDSMLTDAITRKLRRVDLEYVISSVYASRLLPFIKNKGEI